MFADMSVMEIIQLLLPVLVIQLILMITALFVLVKAEKVRFLPKWVWAVIIVLGEILGPIIFLTVGREKDV